MNVKKRFCIFNFAPYDQTHPEDVKKALEELKANNIETAKVVTNYNGKEEESHFAYIEDDVKFNLIVKLAYSFLQESILIVNEDRKCYLYSLVSFDQKFVGDWTSVQMLDAVKKDNWIMDQQFNYFICA